MCCTVYCVLCTVCSVLCSVFCLLCTVYCVLSTVYYALMLTKNVALPFILSFFLSPQAAAWTIGGEKTKFVDINPKSIIPEELYGYVLNPSYYTLYTYTL